MKKSFFVILAVFVVVAILLIFKLPIFLSPEKQIEQQEIIKTSKESKEEFERNYHGKIKTAFVKNFGMLPPWERTESLLRENLLAKERLGVNTYHTFTCYMYEKGHFKSCVPFVEEMYKAISEEISAVKKAGLAIDFSSSWGVGSKVNLADREDLERFLEEYKKILVKDAKFAEKYMVEYFSLNEPDHLIEEQPFHISENDKVEIINKYKNDVVPKIKEVYNGKIYYQIGDAVLWNFTKLNVSGLDYFGVLIGGMCDFEIFKRKVDEIFSKAESLSENSGVPWIISELWINKIYNEGENSCDLTGKRSKYYEYVFEKAKKSENLKGIMIDTWNVDEEGFETSVKDTPSEQTIKEFFEIWE